MASVAKHIAFFFFIVLSSSVHIQARESKFFNKIFHLGAKISPLVEPTPTPAAAPVMAPTPAPATAPANIGSEDPYYGLYGHGSGMFTPEKEGVTTSNTPTTTTSFENDLFAEELADERYETGYEKSNNNGYTTSNYNNNGYTNTNSNYNNNNGYTNTNSNYNNNNGYTNTNSNYNNNGYTNTNYNNNGYESERQGMSDTRFVEGGKYYHDVKNENYYPNGYEFSSSKETSKNEGYYGNTENSNEFNSMEEFENKEDQYLERHDEYLP